MYGIKSKSWGKWVKALTVLVTVLLLASACAPGATSTRNEPTQSETTVSPDGREMRGNMYLTGLPIVKEKETFTMLITYSGNNVDPNEMGVHKKLEEKTNIKIEFDFVLPAAAKERKATMFASGDYTDLVGGDILNDSDVNTYGSQGVLIPLDDLIKEYMPRFSSILDNDPQVRKQITSFDGNIYAFPILNYRSCWPDPDHYAVPTWNINKIWLKNLDMEIPKTTDELVSVLKAFKTQDPNKNGIADEIPMTMEYAAINRSVRTCLYPAFGFADYDKHIDVIDGKVVYTAALPQYKDAMKYMRYLYQEGLIDPESFTQDRAKFTAKVAQTDPTIVGIFSAFGGYQEAGSDRILEEFDDILPLVGPAGVKLWGRQNSGVTRNKLAITSKCDRLDIIARWADELYEEEISIELEYGMLGKQTAKTPDGKYQQVDPPGGGNVEQWLRTDTTRVLPHAVIDAEKVLLNQDSTTKLNKSLKYVDFVDPEIFPPVIMTEEETTELSRLEASINALTDQKTAEWITGKADIDAEWDSFQQELKKLGLERILDIRQKAMERYNSN